MTSSSPAFHAVSIAASSPPPKLISIDYTRFRLIGPGRPSGRDRPCLLASEGGAHDQPERRRIPHGQGSDTPARREAGDALRLREPRRAPELSSGDQAPAALPPGGGGRPPAAGAQRDPRRERHSAPRPDAAFPDPARRVLDPGLTWQRSGGRPSSTRGAIWPVGSTSRGARKRSAIKASG